MGIKEKIVLDIPIKLKGSAWIPAGARYEKSYELNSLALLAIEKALASELGWEKTLAIVRGTWKKMAREGVKKIIHEFNLKGNGADTVMKIFSILAILLGFKHKITKLTKDEAIGVIYSCSHWNAMVELNIEKIWRCDLIHMDFVQAAIEEINPELEAILESSIPQGDPECRMIIRRKAIAKTTT